MAWNYRIIRQPLPPESRATLGDYHYGLYEVHYDASGKPNGRSEPLAGFAGEAPSEIVAALELALRDAKERPILDEWDILGLEHAAPTEALREDKGG